MSRNKFKIIWGMFGALLCCGVAFAAPVAVNPDHPDRYVVVKGDTLWDIAARFLRTPWRWPDVWQVNPQISNPHLIYPGDTIVMTYVDGEPRLGLIRGQRVVKLSPRVRREPLDAAIPTIPIDAIQPFLTRPYVLNKADLQTAPYVVDFVDEHILGGIGNQIYVRTIDTTRYPNFNVIRPGGPYRDPDTREVLGYEALYVGDASLQRTGDPATLMLERTEMETIIGDRLLPVVDEVAVRDFFPKAPDVNVEAKIISVINGVYQIGQYHVVVLNKGAEDGLERGDVLQVFKASQWVRDVVSPYSADWVALPEEEAGVLLIFRTFDRVSFGLVMYATRAMHIYDVARSPQY